MFSPPRGCTRQAWRRRPSRRTSSLTARPAPKMRTTSTTSPRLFLCRRTAERGRGRGTGGGGASSAVNRACVSRCEAQGPRASAEADPTRRSSRKGRCGGDGELEEWCAAAPSPSSRRPLVHLDAWSRAAASDLRARARGRRGQRQRHRGGTGGESRSLLDVSRSEGTRGRRDFPVLLQERRCRSQNGKTLLRAPMAFFWRSRCG
jgi:hypothetical protein